jgi:hypothetical protein
MKPPPRNVEFDDVRDVKIVLGSLLERLDPDAIPTCDARKIWTEFVSVWQLGMSAATLMARRVEDAGAWDGNGARSAADDMAKTAGTSNSEARRMLQTSKRVKRLPKTEAKMRKGELSPAKTEAIADAATAVPDAEDALLENVENKTVSQVRDACLNAKATSDPDERYGRIHRERRLTQYTDKEGAWNLYGRGPVDAQAEFKAAHEPILDELFQAARANGQHEPREAYAFDALIELARRATGQPTTTEEPAGAPEAPDAPKSKRPPARYTGIVRVDLEAMRRGWIEGEETCEIRGVGPIPVRVARDLLGEAVLKLVITKGVDVLNVTHLGRAPTAAQQAALWWISPTCTVEGCNRTQFVENDHRIEWTKTKHTRLCELDPLCTHHHSLKTNKKWSLITGTGKRAMVPPADPRHPKNKPKR